MGKEQFPPHPIPFHPKHVGILVFFFPGSLECDIKNLCAKYQRQQPTFFGWGFLSQVFVGFLCFDVVWSFEVDGELNCIHF